VAAAVAAKTSVDASLPVVAVKTSVDANLPAVVNAARRTCARATVAGPATLPLMPQRHGAAHPTVLPIPQRRAVARRMALPIPQQRAEARRMVAVAADHMVADRMAAANANSQSQ
jgi:hypothetical protein